MSTAAELARSGPLAQPRICCLDLDTFFVSVERVLDPTLEGKPVVVGGQPGTRGVVTAASYEVRRLGVKSGMSLIEAGKLAPNAIYLPTRGDTYGSYAERVRDIARRYSPIVLVASIDEMFLDFTGCERLYGRPGGDDLVGNPGRVPGPPAIGSDGQSPSSPDADDLVGNPGRVPGPPAIGSDGQSPSSPDADDLVGNPGRVPGPPAIGSDGQSPSSPDANGDAAIERAVLELAGAIDSELGLPASAGIATSRVMAKVASALAKPRGVMLVPAGVERAVLAPLPVRAFPGIGPVAEGKLHAAGYQTLGAVADAPADELRAIFGAWGPSIQRGVQGHGSGALGRERPAFSEHDPEGETVGSISNERTFREDVRDPATIESVLCGLCERVCWRARKRAVKARTVTLKLRYSDFHTLTRARTLAPTHSELELYPVLKEMLAAARTRPLPVRLLGVQLSNLGIYEQLSLFDHNERAGAVVDKIRERYGFSMVTLATQLGGARK